MVLELLIVGLVEVASGALVHVATTAVEKKTSSDLDTRFVFFNSAQAAAALDTANLATLARLIVRGSV